MTEPRKQDEQATTQISDLPASEKELDQQADKVKGGAMAGNGEVTAQRGDIYR